VNETNFLLVCVHTGSESFLHGFFDERDAFRQGFEQLNQNL
jgi:hypothetical protein